LTKKYRVGNKKTQGSRKGKKSSYGSLGFLEEKERRSETRGGPGHGAGRNKGTGNENKKIAQGTTRQERKREGRHAEKWEPETGSRGKGKSVWKGKKKKKVRDGPGDTQKKTEEKGKQKQQN